MKGQKILSKVLTVIALVGATALGRLYYQNSQVPRLGVSQGRFQPLSPKPNGVSSQTDVASQRVEPWTFKDTQGATMAALKAAVAAYGGAAVKTQTDDYLYVVFTTPSLRFHDDVEFWLNTSKREVEFRSSSRAGYSDMGLNRERYQKLSELYHQQH